VNFTFPKSERLTQKKVIDILFKKDNPIVSEQFVYPFRVLYLSQSEDFSSPQMLISVSKKRYKKAVDRNLIKRRTREAYRLNKGKYNNLPEYIAFMYIAKTIEPFDKIEKKLCQILQSIAAPNEIA